MLGRGIFGCICSLAALLAMSGISAAAIITPNTTADQFNTDAANCSLREAVWAADNNSAAMAPGCTAGNVAMDTIQLAPATYDLTIPPVGSSTDLASGDLEHNSPLNVEGLPGGRVTIDANQIDRIFQSFGSLTVDGVTLTGGFVDNPTPGGGVTGGAIAASSGNVLTMTDSAVAGNRSDGGGGGIAWPGSVSLTNVTVSGNTSTETGGGGIRVSVAGSILAMDHVTVTDNHAVTDGTMSGGNFAGGVSVLNPATATIHNSILAGNTENSTADDEPNCEGSFTSGGGNILGSIAGCTITPLASDEAGVIDPGLAPLGDYGGPSLTHALLMGSTAIDQGVAACQASDQRGIARGGPPCDAGGYEVLAGDADGDSVVDGADNCPADVNPNQANNDGDSMGDACDPDDDNDGVADVTDNCPLLANADQLDFDGDTIGNACDPTPGSPPATTPTTPTAPLSPSVPATAGKKCKKGRKLKKGKCVKKKRKKGKT